MKKWIAFFTMTGSEIYNVANRMCHCPDAVITNRPSIDGINSGLLSIAHDRMYFLPKQPTVEEYHTALLDAGVDENTVVTLHGYLRVLPPKICESYNIINCHPALISKYPELKNLDPQKRSLNYRTIGTTLHKVIAAVDEGVILKEREIKNTFYTVEEITDALRRESEELWMELLAEQLYYN